MKVVEFKLYPNKYQLERIELIRNRTKCLYNEALEQRIVTYKETGNGLNYYDQAKTFKGYQELPASVNQSVLRKLDITYKAFFSRGHGYPRFKPNNRYNIIELRQYKTDGYLKDGKLRLWKMDIRLRGGQELINPKQGRLVKRADGWYWQVTCENILPEKKKRIQTKVGLDMGLKSYVMDSEGKSVKAPKLFRATERKLGKQQRQLSKKIKGSFNRNKSRLIVAKTHLKIARQRKDFLHKLSRKYADYDLIAIEKLNTKGMLRNRHLSKSISDASWGIFFSMLRYKAEGAGSYLVEVNPQYTSQDCSQCGAYVQKSLSVRTHICQECGYIADRDFNASQNILRAGIALAGENGLPISMKAEASSAS